MDVNLAERVARLEAIEEIKTLKHRYLRACDAKDPEAFRACFVAEGAVLDYGERIGRFEGIDALVAVFERVALNRIDGRYTVFDMHHAMHGDIEITGTGSGTGMARGRWTLRFRQVDTVAGTERVSAIEYDDGYTAADGAWRIARCQVKTLWTMSRPLAEGCQIAGELA
ncbi:nuclear transport factor 2 family protein [Streptomyces sp. NPDC058534]|uniref:nuclear transport factor 2 family protein n=1 Tax=Streptomyces sp. NPDC058534 TaxID=3346541 RepID=UPI00364DFF16